MFGPVGGGGWNILGPSSANLLDKERPAPPRVLPLEFPKHVPPSAFHPLSRPRIMSFRSSLLRLRKPSDVCDSLLAHLNIHIESNVPLSTLVPSEQFTERPFLYDTDLESMLAELDIPNEDAYREILRLPPHEGRKKPRLAYSRYFFAGLDDMRRYYDDSKDDYYDVDVPEDEHEGLRKLDDQTRDQTAKTASQDPESGRDSSNDKDNDGDTTMTSKPLSPNSPDNSLTSPSHKSQDPGNSTSTPRKSVYKGIRLSNADHLPPQTRTSTVRNLLKMATHKFSCRDYDLSPRERLRFVDVNMPPSLAMPTFVVGKTPAEVRLARGRFVEGPVLGVCVRHECVFTEEGLELVRQVEGGGGMDVSEALGGAFDLGREVGSLLALALMRNREGKGSREEVMARESQGWWWTKNERWGGGPTKWGQLACEVYEDEDPSWSPEERRLQEEKRKEAEEEMKRIPEEIGKGTGDVSVDDLIVREMKKDGKKAEEAEKGRSEHGPPKKKNRIEISSHSSNDNAIEIENFIDSSSSSSSDLLTPTGPTISSAPNANSQSISTSTSTSTANSIKNRNNTKNSKSKPRSEEVHDGRRAMYVAPMRKRWYREWTVLRGNRSTWDEKVIWRRIGAPSRGITEKPHDAERSGDAETTGGRDAVAAPDKDGNGHGNGDGSRNRTGNGHGAAGDAEPYQKGMGLDTPVTAERSKERSTEWDEIYQISSVHHHVAIMKMRVSRRYLRWLETGDVEGEAAGGDDGKNERREGMPQESKRGERLQGENQAKQGRSLNEGNEADILSIQRSQWFDMFDVDARKEFLVGVWRVMCWLCRDEVSRG